LVRSQSRYPCRGSGFSSNQLEYSVEAADSPVRQWQTELTEFVFWEAARSEHSFAAAAQARIMPSKRNST
jgi:hypothetical protein